MNSRMKWMNQKWKIICINISLIMSSLFLFFIFACAAIIIAGAEKFGNGVYANHLKLKGPENVPKNTTNLKSGSGGWVYYNQCDYRWANQRLGWCDDYTLCTGGCAMSSTAMILATKGVNVDPSSLDDWLSNNGGYANGCDLIWGSIDAFGVTSFQGMENADEDSICNGLAQGHGIVANVNNGEHWVLLTGCLGGGVFSVNDPAFSRDSYGIWEILMEAVYH
jgi:hypothetical protein